MNCCANCFVDSYLRKEFPNIASSNGRCDYCGSEGVALIAPAALKDLFSPVVAIYAQGDQGKQLVECLQEDWQPFNVTLLGPQGARSLLADVLDDGELVRGSFVVAERYRSPGLHQRWESLRDELINRNRYFPEQVLEETRFRALLGLLKAAEPPTVWFRARVQSGATPYPIDQMGAPPKDTASHGRANPPGIPYLYLASNRETAAAEIRPHTGEAVCVAEFQLPAGLEVVDLREPRRLISPFVLGDEDKIAALRSDVPFIEGLGEELTRPVVPHRAAIDYVPSQYLCEFIKMNGWHGVLYRSSVGDGMNMALFDPLRATGHGVRQMRVSRVTVSVE